MLRQVQEYVVYLQYLQYVMVQSYLIPLDQVSGISLLSPLHHTSDRLVCSSPSSWLVGWVYVLMFQN